jgi:diacylglycerol O-acyltransferase
MQIMALAILRPAGQDGETPTPITLDDVHRHLTGRVELVGVLQRCVIPVPFGLHHPVLTEATDFKFAHHLHHVTLPAPAGPHELDRLYASLAGRCLDRRHPLWRLTLVDGLDDGRQALIFEIHHCLTDGTALLTMFSRLFLPEQAQHSPQAYRRRPQRPPGRWPLILDAMADHGGGLTRLVALGAKIRRGKVAIRHQSAGSPIAVPRPTADTPHCSLNAGFTSQRRFARASLSMNDIRLVKDIAGVTVNDVVLSVVAGALRDYLLQRCDLPDRPLVANVPVGMDTPGDSSRGMGNRFTRLVTSLATDVVDPWLRLQTISTVTAESKRCLDLMGREVLGESLDLMPPALTRVLVQRVERRRRRHPDRLDTNVLVSNLRGPAKLWSFGSAVVEEMYLTAPPNGGVGVTFAVWDYVDTLLVGILSLADSVECPAELAVGLSCALNELVRMADCRRGESTAVTGVMVGDR